jgi:hypothetical protein
MLLTQAASINLLAYSFLSLIVLLLLLLLFAPAVLFLMFRWFGRRDEILASFTDQGVRLYFALFYPEYAQVSGDAKQQLRKYYGEQYDWKHFLTPLILAIALSGCLFAWVALTISDWLAAGQWRDFSPWRLPTLGVIAIAGAYMYCLTDQFTHWSSWDLAPSDLYWLSFRMVVAVPVAYALFSAVKNEIAAPLAFLIGVFPTNTLLTMLRRLATDRFGLADVPKSGSTELQKLSGIDLRISEMLAEEGLSTIAQLAYADPVKLSIRTSLQYSLLVDCISQAIFYLYVGDNISKLVPVGLRGAYEVRDLCLDLNRTDAPEKAERAEKILLEVASLTAFPAVGVRNILRMVAYDAYTKFLYESFANVFTRGT